MIRPSLCEVIAGWNGARGGWLRKEGADRAGRRVDTAARRTSQSARALEDRVVSVYVAT